MKNIKRLLIIGVAMLCLPLCGAWTAAYAQQQTDPQTEQRYVDAQLISAYAVNSETIEYVSKTVIENIETDKGAPGYFAVDELQNACGAVAGTVAVGFYDKYYSNMIPDWNSYYSNGNYRLQDGTYVPKTMRDLYNRMETNVVAPGVSEAEFKTGLTSYINGVGYDISYNSVWNGTFNYTAYKNAVNNNRVTVLFVKPSDIYVLGHGDTTDVVSSMNITGNHVMIAYGYYEIRYTLINGTRTDVYLKVITGFSGTKTAYYKVGSYIDSAYILEIN